MKIDEKKRIGIDIDEVVVEFMANFLIYSNKKNNTFFTSEDVTNYRLWETKIHKSKEESIKEVLEFQNSPYFDKIDLIEGAKEGLEEISKNRQIYFITSRPEEIKDKTKSFFNKHFPKNGFNILYSGELYGGKLSKTEICKNLEIPLIIEDNPDYALGCAREGIKVFLLNKFWNKNCEEHPNITQVDNWKTILERLK